MKYIIGILVVVILNIAQVLIRHELNIYPDSALVSFVIGCITGLIVVIVVELCD